MKPMPCAFAPFNLTTCFSSEDGWRGPCFARHVTAVTICCKRRLGLRPPQLISVPNPDGCACGTKPNTAPASPMIIQSRPPAKPADSAPTPLTPEAEPPPSPTGRFALGFPRQRDCEATPYPDRDNGARSRRECARNTKTRLKPGTFEHRPATGTVEPCRRQARPPGLSCAPGENARSDDPGNMDVPARTDD